MIFQNEWLISENLGVFRYSIGKLAGISKVPKSEDFVYASNVDGKLILISQAKHKY